MRSIPSVDRSVSLNDWPPSNDDTKADNESDLTASRGRDREIGGDGATGGLAGGAPGVAWNCDGGMNVAWWYWGEGDLAGGGIITGLDGSTEGGLGGSTGAGLGGSTGAAFGGSAGGGLG